MKPVRPPRGLPKHITCESKWGLLYRFANSIAALYGAPVYLCGSALRSDNDDPRDWDIRIMLSEAEFARRFGDPVKWADEGCTGRYSRVRWRWSDECCNRSRQGFAETRLNIDLQIYPTSHARRLYRGKKRVRIDTRKSA